MEAREEFSRLMAWLIENSDKVDSDQIKADIMLLQGAAGQLVSKLTISAEPHRPSAVNAARLAGYNFAARA